MCEAKYFCDLYIFSKVEKGEINISIFSRIFQTRWGTPPIIATASRVELIYSCDGVYETYQWPFSVGAIYGDDGLPSTEQNLTNYMPLYYDQKLDCSSIELRQLVFKDVIYRLKSGFRKTKDLKFEL